MPPTGSGFQSFPLPPLHPPRCLLCRGFLEGAKGEARPHSLRAEEYLETSPRPVCEVCLRSSDTLSCRERERFAATLIKGSSFGVKSQLQKAAGEEAGEGNLAPGAGQ